MTADDESILVELAPPVARVILNRPERHNALGVPDLPRLAEVMAAAAAAAGIRVVILTGRGKSFCSGVALQDVAGSDWTVNPLTMLARAIEALPVPTICALNGGVYGGGVEIALACDFRIGVTGMKMFVPPARLGIHYEADGLARFVRVLGLQAARRIFLAAEAFDGAGLHRIGFLDRLVEGEALDVAAQALAREIAGLAPLAVQGMKRTLNEIAAGSLDADAASARIQACWASADHAEGMAAMADKRQPAFEGR